MVGLQSDKGRAYLFELAVHQLETTEDLRVEVEALGGTWPFSLTAKGVVLFDEGQRWLTAEKVSVTCSPMALLWSSVVLPTVHIEGLTLHKTDTLTKERKSTESPWTVVMPAIIVDDFRFGEDFLAAINATALREQLSAIGPMTARGAMTSDLWRRKWTIAATISGVNAPNASTYIAGYAQRFGGELYVDATATAAPGGVAAKILQLPYAETTTLSVLASGPFISWRRAIADQGIAGDGAIKGTFSGTVALSGDNTPAVFYALAGDSIEYHGEVSVTTARTIALQGVTAHGHALTVEGDASWDRDQTIDAASASVSVDLDIVDSSDVVDAAGFLKVAIDVEGTFSTPSFSLVATSSDARFGRHKVHELEATASMQRAAAGLAGGVTFRGALDDVAVDGSCDVRWESGKDIDITAFTVTMPQSRAQGAATVLLPSRVVVGEVFGSTDNFAFWSSLVGLNVSGAGDFRVIFSPSISRGEKAVAQAIEVSINAERATIGRIYTENVALNVEVCDCSADFHGEVKFHASHVQGDHWVLKEVSMRTPIDMAEAAWPYEAEVHGDGDTGIKLTSNGLWHVGSDGLTLNIHDLLAATPHQEYRLEKSATVLASPTTFTIDDIAVRVTPTGENSGGEGFFKGGVTFTAKERRALLTFDNLPTDLWHEIDPSAPATGTLSGTVTISDEAGRLTGSVALRIHDLQLLDEGLTNLPTLDGVVTAAIDGHVLTVDGTISGIGATPLEVKGTIPLTPADNAAGIAVDRNAPLSLTMNVRGDITPFVELLIADVNRIKGEATVAMEITGSINAPVIKGKAQLRNGAFRSLRAGVTLENVQAEFEGSGRRLLLTTFTAHDGNKGYVEGSGSMVCDPALAFPFDLTVNVNKTLIYHQDFARIAVNGTMQFTGNLEGAHLAASLDVASAAIAIPKNLPARVPTLNVTYINEPALRPPTDLPPSALPRVPITFDVDIRVPGDVHIEGRGLKSEWQGYLKIAGDSDKPVVDGKLTVKHGDFSFSGKQFVITQGTLVFDDEPGAVSLNVHGELQLDATKVIAIFKGPINNPQLFLYSNPTLPEKEVLSLVLFDKHSSEISPLQALQLAQTVSSLSGERIGPDVLGNIRRTVGLDRLDIGSTATQNGNNELSVQAGKYLSRGVYIMVSKSINADNSRVGVEANLTPSIKVKGEMGAETGGQMSLKWKRDY